MDISSAVGGYVHFASSRPKPSHSRLVGKDTGHDSRTSEAQQQQSTSPAAAKGKVNLLV